MKKKLSLKELIIVGSTLFGMFFGAGNLIFPVHLGQLAGRNVVVATLGFIITGVTIPILAVASIGSTHSDGLQDLCNKKVGKGFSYFFTCLLYLTIGPFFAIPRTCTTTFSTGIYPLFNGANESVLLLIFSFIFFALVLFFSLKPNKITTSIGKIINPLFLIFMVVLLIAALVNPSIAIKNAVPDGAYSTAGSSIFNGIIEGYNTMDAIAGLAFGIIVVEIVRKMDISDDSLIAKETIKAGVITAIMMAVIYIANTIMGAQSRGLFEISENGGIALAQISNHYLGTIGSIVLALTIGLACLKTAIGLVIACSETFVKMFPKALSYKAWAIIFSVFSFAISNVGLTKLINYSLPVLMFIYPIAIVLIIVAMLDKLFDGNKLVYILSIIGAMPVAILDLIKTLPFGIDVSKIGAIFPFYSIGFGWFVPAVLGFVVGLIITKVSKKKA